jgi:hypothetical protein
MSGTRAVIVHLTATLSFSAMISSIVWRASRYACLPDVASLGDVHLGLLRASDRRFEVSGARTTNR